MAASPSVVRWTDHTTSPTHMQYHTIHCRLKVEVLLNAISLAFCSVQVRVCVPFNSTAFAPCVCQCQPCACGPPGPVQVQAVSFNCNL
jgi:hypothetical protein